MTCEQLETRFNKLAAIWLLCRNYHSGQWSRGYKLLCKIEKAGFNPGLGLREYGRLENEEQKYYYYCTYWKLRKTL